MRRRAAARPSAGGAGGAGGADGGGGVPVARRHALARARRRPAAGGCEHAPDRRVLRCTSAGSSLTIATGVPASTNGPATYGYCRNTGAPDREHEVVRRQRLPQARAVGRQVAGEQRVILREAGARAERLLPDRAREPLGQRDERLPRVGIVGARPDDERRARSAGDSSASSATAPASAARDCARRGAGAARSSRLARRRQPSRPSARSRAPGRCR